MKKNRFGRIIGNLLIMLTAFMLILGILEVIFRIFAPQNLSGSWTMLDKEGLMMNKPNWTSRHELAGRTVRYRFNSHHLRGEEVDTAAYKILCLGDSYTFGWLLEEGDSYVGILDSLAKSSLPGRRIQVLNGGVGGYGMADYTEFLHRLGPEIKPDMVIVFFNGGDLNRSLNRKGFNLKAGQGLKSMLNENRSYQWLLEHSHLVQWVKSKAISTYLPMPGPMAASGDKVNFDSALKMLPPAARLRMDSLLDLGDSLVFSIDAWCNRNDASFVITTTGFFGFDSFAAPTAEEVFVRGMDSHLEGTNAMYFDIGEGMGPEIMKDYKPFIIPGDQHPNEAGAALVANETWKRLHPVLDSILGVREGFPSQKAPLE